MGSYTDLLQEDEELVLAIRPHWWSLIDAVGALAGAVALGVLAVWVSSQPLQWAAAVMLVAALVFFTYRYLHWSRTNFIVTSERVIFQRGLIARRGTQMPLEKINTVDFHQGVFERIIGAGDLVIESGSEAGIDTFTDIRRPLHVQQEINRQIDRHEKQGFSPRAATIPEQIAQLADLRTRGVLSDAEFETKKADLLSRM
ncbi:MAG: PH domain-containing protein [Acidimicrobiales bacterium]